MTKPPETPAANKIIRTVAFVARCAGAATLAYTLAHLMDLSEPVWAAMSAIIVSQEHLHDTRSSLKGRILGTLLGIFVSIVASQVGSRFGASSIAEMAVAVAICALVVHKFPSVRVAMWTCPLILVSADPSIPIATVALRRGSEVVLGAAVGWAFHWAVERLVEAWIAALQTSGSAARRNLPLSPKGGS